VPNPSFDLACDRLSNAVDAALFKRLHWERTDAPILARLVELVQATVADRPEFELGEEGATNVLKRWVLKVHSQRVMAISLWLADGQAHAKAEAIERSRFRLAEGAPISVACDGIDEAWMATTLEALISRVEC
jgi:hypothetical protein